MIKKEIENINSLLFDNSKTTKIAYNDLENISIEWFKEIGYQFAHGPDIAPDSTSPERNDFRKVRPQQSISDWPTIR